MAKSSSPSISSTNSMASSASMPHLMPNMHGSTSTLSSIQTMTSVVTPTASPSLSRPASSSALIHSSDLDYELELMSDAKYKQYVKQVDNALKGFEYTSEWADLVNALGKLNKVLQNNTKYPVIPRRLVVGQRLAQCMHPQLPSGVHLKALETYDLIFKCIGSERLVNELSIYSNGLFPLLSHAAITVKPALLEVYQTHFLPLGDRLRPALEGFLIAVLPGLEEGSEYHDTTQSLLKNISDGVGQEFFFTALWRCILNNASVRLAGVSFVFSQFNKKRSLEDQAFIMGSNVDNLINGICCSLLDPNILIQRGILDLLISAFPLHTKQLRKEDLVFVITAALTVVLRRDISLNRRLFSWFRNSLDANPAKPSRKGDHYFDKYSKPLVSQAVVLTLRNPSEVISLPNAWSTFGDLWPYKLLVCLLDRPELRRIILDDVSAEVLRALYQEPRSEMSDKQTNLLISNLGVVYCWKRIMKLLTEACEKQYKESEIKEPEPPNEFVGIILRKKSRKYSSSSFKFLANNPSHELGQEDERGFKNVGGGHYSIREACAIFEYLSGLTSMEKDVDSSSCLRLSLNVVLENMNSFCRQFTLQEFKSMMRLSRKLLQKIQVSSCSSSDNHNHVHRQHLNGLEMKSSRALYSSSSSSTGMSSHEPDPLQEIREEQECESLPINVLSNNNGLHLTVVSESDQALTPSPAAVTPSTEDSGSFASLPISLGDTPSSLSLASSVSTLASAVSTATLTPEDSIESVEEKIQAQQRDGMAACDDSSRAIVFRVKKLFAVFVETRLVSPASGFPHENDKKDGKKDDRVALLRKCFHQLLTLSSEQNYKNQVEDTACTCCSIWSAETASDRKSTCSLPSCCSSTNNNLNIQGHSSSLTPHNQCSCRCGCCLSIDSSMSSLFDDICQLLIQTSFIPKSGEEENNRHLNQGFLLKKEIRAPSETRSSCCETRDGGENEEKWRSRRENEGSNDDDVTLPDWIRHLLVLATFPQGSGSPTGSLSPAYLRVAYTSVSTYLSLVRMMKGKEFVLPLSTLQSLAKTSPLSSPVLEFTSISSALNKDPTDEFDRNRSSTSPIPVVELVDPMLSPHDLTEICKLTRFYPVVTSLLWDKMSDVYSELHLQTAILMQQIHNLSNDESNPICETVICNSMASVSEVTSYEARKRFCTLFSITRDIEGSYPAAPTSGSFTAGSPSKVASSLSSNENDKSSSFLFQRREFDRPLFFLLDSLSHKLDVHNAQAVDWLNTCIKRGEMARILEPLLFILLHPDTSRVSVQHVQLQSPGDQVVLLVDSNSKPNTQDQDAADNAAQAAAEARIYAISSTGGNVMYHVAPSTLSERGIRGVNRSQASRSSSQVNKITAVTSSQGPLAHSSSTSSLRSKFVTSKFNNLSDYEVPPSHENNIISGKYMKMTLNPFGSISSLPNTETSTITSDDTTSGNLSNVSKTSIPSFDSSSITSAPGNLDGILSQAKKLDNNKEALKKSMGFQEKKHPNGNIVHLQHQLHHSLDQESNVKNRALNVNFADDSCLKRKTKTSGLLKIESFEGVLCESSSSDTGSETEVVVEKLLDEIVDQIARNEGEDVGDDGAAALEADEVSDDEDDDSNSSTTSSDATTTRATASSMSINSSWSKPVSVNPLHCHLLLYSQVYDSRRTLYALNTLWNIIVTHSSKVLFSLSTTSVSNRLGVRSQELQSLCARHRKSLLGKGFYSELDTESVTSFRSHTFLEVIITTCLYYIRSYYPRLPNSARLTEEEVVGNQKVRVLSCEILRLIFSELIAIVKDKPTSHPFSSYINDLLLRCKVQKSVLHSLVSSVYNYQRKSSQQDVKSTNNNNNEDYFLDQMIELNEKSSAFQEDMQKSLLKLLEQLMILEYKSSPNSMHDKEFPTHNRKGSDSKASRIRFLPQMSSLKYCPNVPIPSQAMFLAAIQTALQQSCKPSLHSNWLQLVESSLGFAGRSLTRLVVCVVCILCTNLEGLSEMITKYKSGQTEDGKTSDEEVDMMTPNHLIVLLKSLGTLCHHCLCDSGSTSGPSSPSLSPTPNSNAGGSSVISINPLTTISNIFHAFTAESLMNENHSSQTRDSNHDPLTSTRRTLLTHLPRILSALRNIWKAVSHDPQDFVQESSEARRPRRSASIVSNYSFYSMSSRQQQLPSYSGVLTNGWQVMGSSRDVRLAVLDLLSPISILHGTNFIGSVAVAWYDLREAKRKTNSSLSSQPASVIPKCSQDQIILVELIAAVKVLPMDLIIQHVKQALKSPPQSSHSRKKQIALEVCLLQFFLSYIRIHAASERSQQLHDSWKSLLSLIREGLNCSANQPLAQFHLLAILHEFVQAAPLLEDRRDQKELQDVAQKLVDTCTNVAGAGLSQTRWLKRNLEVRPVTQYDSHHYDDETDGESENQSPRSNDLTANASDSDNNSFFSKFSVQALNALAEFAAPVLDIVYVSEEKEKVVPLISNIMYYVTPYLKKHSKDNARSFMAGSHLLASITEYQYSRKAWKKDAFDLFLDPTFFQMEETCLDFWKIIIDNLMTHDKTTFREYLSRMSSVKGSSMTLFTSKDQENEQRAQLLKKLAFILFCSEKNQYVKYLSDIQDKLIEYLRVSSSPLVRNQIQLCFRVLLLRMSQDHLTSLLPFIYTEMLKSPSPSPAPGFVVWMESLPQEDPTPMDFLEEVPM